MGCAQEQESLAPKSGHFHTPKTTSTVEPVSVSNRVMVKVDNNVSVQWNIEDAIEAWNKNLPCDYFLLTGYSNRVLYIEQTYDPNSLNMGEHTTSSHYNQNILLNSYHGYELEVLLHELGHALGLGHSDSGLMAAETPVTGMTQPDTGAIDIARGRVLC